MLLQKESILQQLRKKNKLVMDPAVAMPNLFDGFFAVPAGQAVTIVPAPEELEF